MDNSRNNGNNKIDGYITIPSNNINQDLTSKFSNTNLLSNSDVLDTFKNSINMYSIQNALPNFRMSEKLKNTLSDITKSQLSLSSIYLRESVINSITNSLTSVAKRIIEMHTTMMNEVLKNIQVNPFFNELSESLKEAKKNPHSFLSWYNYYKKLSEYFWIYPYDMEPEKLHTILEKVNSEKEFDSYISRYFSRKKLKTLFSTLKNNIPRKHKTMLHQIETAFNSKSFALANDGLMSIIDDLLSFYIYDKGCQKRLGIFEPIIKQLEEEKDDIDSDVLLIMMTNNYINNLYDEIEFNEKIKIITNKKTRRHTYAHGKFYSNKRIDSIMLLNTIYYLLVAQDILNKYKNKLFYEKNKGFYIPKGNDRKQAVDKIEKSIIKKKEKKVQKNNQDMEY